LAQFVTSLPHCCNAIVYHFMLCYFPSLLESDASFCFKFLHFIFWWNSLFYLLFASSCCSNFFIKHHQCEFDVCVFYFSFSVLMVAIIMALTVERTFDSQFVSKIAKHFVWWFSFLTLFLGLNCFIKVTFWPDNEMSIDPSRRNLLSIYITTTTESPKSPLQAILSEFWIKSEKLLNVQLATPAFALWTGVTFSLICTVGWESLWKINVIKENRVFYSTLFIYPSLRFLVTFMKNGTHHQGSDMIKYARHIFGNSLVLLAVCYVCLCFFYRVYYQKHFCNTLGCMGYFYCLNNLLFPISSFVLYALLIEYPIINSDDRFVRTLEGVDVKFQEELIFVDHWMALLNTLFILMHYQQCVRCAFSCCWEERIYVTELQTSFQNYEQSKISYYIQEVYWKEYRQYLRITFDTEIEEVFGKNLAWEIKQFVGELSFQDQIPNLRNIAHDFLDAYRNANWDCCLARIMAYLFDTDDYSITEYSDTESMNNESEERELSIGDTTSYSTETSETSSTSSHDSSESVDRSRMMTNFYSDETDLEIPPYRRKIIRKRIINKPRHHIKFKTPVLFE